MAGEVARNRWFARFFWLCRRRSEKKRQEERPPEPEKAGGKHLAGFDAFRLV